jgi:pimeloyl-ACP methyl ester carboxylesterase
MAAIRTIVTGLIMTLMSACGLVTQQNIRPDPGTIVSAAGEYDYPFSNPFVATVVGTPPTLRANLPPTINIRTLELDLPPGRSIPQVFWYEDGFRYSLAFQVDKAPLIFLIGGTNAAYNSRLSSFLQRVFFTAGFHVISVSSSTFSNFIVTRSSTGVPGRIVTDAPDLYHLMQRLYALTRTRVPISDIYLTGYSLGGWQAAFIGNLDAQQRSLGFRKVLLINPPVSLFRSVRILDRMLEDNLPNGVDGLDDFFDRVFGAFSELYKRRQAIDLTEDFLHQAYLHLQPSERDLAALIGVSFRLSAANIAFTADVMTDAGYIVPRGQTLTVSTSLTPFLKAGIRRSFEDYFDELLYPFYRVQEPSLTPSDLIAEANLARIDGYLRNTPSVGLVTSADDVILGPGDIEYLRGLFGPRATIFPNGGHCGNLQHRYVVAEIVKFFRE